MKKIYNLFPILAAISIAPLLSSCFQEFEPDIDSTPVLCMNSLITPGDSIDVLLSRTWRWSEGDVDDGRTYNNGDQIDVTVRDAILELYVNGDFKEEMKLVSVARDLGYTISYQDKFRAEYIPKSGDVIRIEAVSKDYGSAWAEVTVPQPVEIFDVDVILPEAPSYVKATGEYIMSPTFKIWFEDPSKEQNFYDFTVGYTAFGYESQYEYGESYGFESFSQFWVEYDHEPLFTEHTSALDQALTETSGYTIFTDRQISGIKYPLTISLTDMVYAVYNPNNNPDIGNATIDFELRSISKSYYEHVLSVWQANDGINGVLGNIGFADLVYASSNVSTNAGVVAAMTPFTYHLPLKTIFEKYPPQTLDSRPDIFYP